MTDERAGAQRTQVLSSFADKIDKMYEMVGKPALTDLARISARQGLMLTADSLDENLRGLSVPSWEFVVAFVSACEEAAADSGMTLPDGAFDLDDWKHLHQGLLEELTREQPASGAARDEPDVPPLITRSLPRLPVHFVGRNAELHRLVSLISEGAPLRRLPPAVVIHGIAGVGKTGLANVLAHRIASLFPDGQHVVNFTRAHTDPRTVADIYADLLLTLGVPTVDVPATADERSELLRSLLASRRLLIILVDVPDPEAVQPLLAGEAGSGSLLIVTSRRGLDGLPGAESVLLTPLSHAEAMALLEATAGADRIAADPAAAADVIGLSGGLPLALRVIGAFLTARPDTPLAELVERLRTPLPDGDEAATTVAPVTAVLEASYRAVSGPAAMVLRRLSLVEEHEEIPRRLVPYLADEAEPEALTAAINELAGAGLLDAPPEAEVIGLHPLVRRYGRDRAAEEDPQELVTAVRDRARRFFLLSRGHRPRPEPLIARDYWTLRDRLSSSHYADAIAEFIRHRQTLPPLTIGLKAPWGAGKTSLMRMIQNTLDPQDDGMPCPIRLDHASREKLRRRRTFGGARSRADTAPGARVTNLEILRQANAVHQEPADESRTERLRAQLAEGAPLRAEEWRPTVWFNPWMYQNGEQVWAGLAHEIITQVTERLPVADRERFWLRLNLARVDRSVIRRSWYRLLAERLLPLLLVWTAAVLVTLGGLAVGQLIDPLRGALRGASAAVLGAGTVAILAGGAGQTLSFLGRTATGPLSSLVRTSDPLAGSQRLLSEQMKAHFDRLVPDPGYAGRLGFLHLVQTDMKRVLDLIATPRRPLVVFVDDLDRCSPATVTQVIEAINLFLAGEFPHCVFVLGMEPGAVAAHVEVAYQDLVRAQRDGRLAGDWSTLGWRFLEKIVQLPLSIPPPHEDGELADYLRSLVESSSGSPVPGVRPTEPRLPQTQSAGRAPADQPSAVADRRAAHAATARDPQHVAAMTRPAPEVVDAIERGIRARQPTPDTLRETALAAQLEVLGLAEPLHPAALSAADRVISDLYSDLDAYTAFAELLPVLGSRNPREIKRFVNLFRFYSFIAERQRLLGGQIPEQRQIAKLAAFSIRWPHVISMLGSADSADVLARLERAARHADSEHWEAELRRTFPVFDAPSAPQPGLPEPADPAPGWGDDLRAFLREGVEIAAAASRFI
ncbi:P-loop NTPase fold protein [Streptomyces sp. 7N604]|uniref:P-loop NTPase fold protein n=1 Tax=Streptomyces sp. 7N604 TaxID=3457415 RepID=UPI003FD28E92